MENQQMTGELIGFENSLPENAYGVMNTIWDQSAKIFAAVIGNDYLLPDDGGNKIHNEAVADQKNHSASRLSSKAQAQLKKLNLARLQEEHALWLK